jgi:hypothetical protein
LLFIVVMAGLCWPVRALVKPRAEDDAFILFYVFFTPRTGWMGCVDVLMQRPLRWLNRLLFWGTVEVVERAWRGRKRASGRRGNSGMHASDAELGRKSVLQASEVGLRESGGRLPSESGPIHLEFNPWTEDA